MYKCTPNSSALWYQGERWGERPSEASPTMVAHILGHILRCHHHHLTACISGFSPTPAALLPATSAASPLHRHSRPLCTAALAVTLSPHPQTPLSHHPSCLLHRRQCYCSPVGQRHQHSYLQLTYSTRVTAGNHATHAAKCGMVFTGATALLPASPPFFDSCQLH